MINKILVTALAALAYVFLLTNIFEYCLNEASSTLLNTIGVVLFVFLTGIYASLVYRLFKKYPKS